MPRAHSRESVLTGPQDPYPSHNGDPKLSNTKVQLKPSAATQEESEPRPAASDRASRPAQQQQQPLGSPPTGPEAAGKPGPRGSKSGQKGKRQEANAKSADMFSHLPPYRVGFAFHAVRRVKVIAEV